MKYPYWNEYDNAKKWKAVEAELALETNNATTNADLTNAEAMGHLETGR